MSSPPTDTPHAGRSVSAPIAGAGGTVLAVLGVLGGVAADYGKSRAGEQFVEFANATGQHIATLDEQIDDLRADKELMLRHNARVREEREELRRELEHTRRLLEAERREP